MFTSATGKEPDSQKNKRTKPERLLEKGQKSATFSKAFVHA